MKGKLLRGFAAVALSGILVLAFGGQSFAKEQVYTFRLANWYPPMSSFNSAVWPFWTQELEKASNGRIKFKIYMAEQLVKEADMWEGIVQGICDIGHVFLLDEAGRFPITDYGSLPMLWPSNRVAAMTMTSLYQKYPQLQEEFKDVQVLWFNINAPAQFFTLKKPIKTLQDLKGLKIQGGGLYFKYIAQYMGFSPVTFPFTEVYDALAKGTIDGNTVEWEGQFIWKWYEQDHYSLGGADLYAYPFVVAMNKKKWESLPIDIQAIFTAYSGLKGAEMMGYIFDQHDYAGRVQIEKHAKAQGWAPIAEISKETRETWKETLQPVRDMWKAEMAKKGVPGEEILKDAEALVEVFNKGPKPWFYKHEDLAKMKF
jgi:TRAP-type C4-dicarboxylate transport system substrate-binding protein